MFYSNIIKTKNMSYKKYKYASFSNGINTEYDERLLPIKYSKNTYNFNYNNGALKTGLGIKAPYFSYRASNRSAKKTFRWPQNVNLVNFWIYTRWNDYVSRYDDYIICYGDNGYVYYGYFSVSAPDILSLHNIHFTSMPNFINYNLNGVDVLIMVSPTDGMYVWDTFTGPVNITDIPNISSMCIHNERLFCTTSGEGRKLYFSDDLDPTNWNISLNEAGFISMVDEKGPLNKVISFEDYLYVFREYGIARVYAKGNQKEFSVSQLFTSSNRIYKNSVCLCGDRIMFLSSDGIYSFNGVTTTKLTLNIDNLLNCNYNDSAIGTYYDGCYYLSCKCTFPDSDEIGCETGEYKNNALLQINLKNGELNILRGVDIICMRPFNNLAENCLIASVNDGESTKIGIVTNNGKIFDNVTKKVWHSPKTNFNMPNKVKLLKSISLNTDTDVTLKFIADNTEKEILVKGSDNVQTIKPNIKGYELSIDFICEEADCNISNPIVEIGY